MFKDGHIKISFLERLKRSVNKILTMYFKGKQNPIGLHILANHNCFSFKLRKFKTAAGAY
jgi:hypothetical protein